jgi:hypothetical protein
VALHGPEELKELVDVFLFDPNSSVLNSAFQKLSLRVKVEIYGNFSSEGELKCVSNQIEKYLLDSLHIGEDH